MVFTFLNKTKLTHVVVHGVLAKKYHNKKGKMCLSGLIEMMGMTGQGLRVGLGDGGDREKIISKTRKDSSTQSMEAGRLR